MFSTRMGYNFFSSKFVDNDRGTVAATFGMMTLVLTSSVGASVDFGRWLNARTHTLAAMDAAVLAAGRVLQFDVTKSAEALATARAYYSENVKNRIKIHADTVNFTIGIDGASVQATGNAVIETLFLRIARINSLPLLATDGSEFAKAKLANAGGSRESLEIALMLDVTGSMSGSKLETLKQAAQNLVDRVVHEGHADRDVRMSIVPFADTIRPPVNSLTLVRGSPAQSITRVFRWLFGSYQRNYSLTNCVAERTGTNAYTDVAPQSQSYLLPVYTSSGTCTPTSGNEVVPLSDDKSVLSAAIDGLEASGGTAGHLGTAWAWYTLSPAWNSVWANADQAAADYSSNTKKIAILMTDGEYNTQYNDAGLGASAFNAANGASSDQARALCAAMKDVGITVYTVGYGLDPDSQAAQTLASCATDRNTVYSADDNDELLQAFHNITAQLSKLYLSN